MPFRTGPTKPRPAEDFERVGSTLLIGSSEDRQSMKAGKIATVVLRDAEATSLLTKFGHITAIKTSDPSEIEPALKKYVEKTKRYANKLILGESSAFDTGMILGLPLSVALGGATLAAVTLILMSLPLTIPIALLVLGVIAGGIATVIALLTPLLTFMAIGANIDNVNTKTKAVEKQCQTDFFTRVKELSVKELKDDFDLYKDLHAKAIVCEHKNSAPSTT